MIFKALLLAVGFIPVTVMSQSSPTLSPFTKPSPTKSSAVVDSKVDSGGVKTNNESGEIKLPIPSKTEKQPAGQIPVTLPRKN